MRSLLILPPGVAALASAADAVIADAGSAPGLYLRLPPLDHAQARDAVRLAAASRPRGVVLPLSVGGADVQRLSARLAVEEARLGLADGSIRVLAMAAESPEAIFGLSSYRGASTRLEALVGGVAPLAAALRADPARRAAGPLRLARDWLLIAARAAGVQAIEAAYEALDDLEGLRAEALAARADGFDGKVALSVNQVAVINEAFG